MDIEHRSNEQVRALLGARLRAFRKSRGLSQTDLADRAGLSRPTISALERGNDVNLDSFLSVLRAFDLLDALNVTVPEPASSPMTELAQRSSPRDQTSRSSPKTNDWIWGDQT